VVSDLLRARGWTLGLAESLTGGLVGSRISDAPGSSEIFLGSIVSYATDVKRSVLGVTAEQVVSAEAAVQMADGARRVLGADVALAVTGVAGPTKQDGQPVGTVYFGVAMPGRETEAVETRLPGNRLLVRQFATISLLNLLRLRLLDRPGTGSI
jgi:PncC family amidohydrolase